MWSHQVLCFLGASAFHLWDDRPNLNCWSVIDSSQPSLFTNDVLHAQMLSLCWIEMLAHHHGHTDVHARLLLPLTFDSAIQPNIIEVSDNLEPLVVAQYMEKISKSTSKLAMSKHSQEPIIRLMCVPKISVVSVSNATYCYLMLQWTRFLSFRQF